MGTLFLCLAVATASPVVDTTCEITSGSYTAVGDDEVGTFNFTVENQSGQTLWVKSYVWEINIEPPAVRQALVLLDTFVAGQGTVNFQSQFTATETGENGDVMFQDGYEVQVMLFKDDNGEPGGAFPGPGPLNHEFDTMILEYVEE